ncbi:hypothetical protein PVAP13_9NG092400 [Panicum virgatum]|uniref:Uncharacterized protein n=1 Tax=Panicum virgatum TaxID=38727 RepID=A0A8T0MN14_PANVG|nr:hypothetical protein PVAP13_9NG092400 [Panicum virgatum]
MQSSSSAHPASQPDEVDVPGRPDFVDSHVQGNRPIPATAELVVAPEHPTIHRDTAMKYFARRFAHAYIIPAGAPGKANPAPFIRAALPSLRYELLPPGHGADRMVLFRSPEDREAAMARQPFALGGASVRLVREGETSDVRRVATDTLAHVALLGYPREQRGVEDIRSNCCGFGHLLEVDPACFAAPDLSSARAVVRTEHAREIPRQV